VLQAVLQQQLPWLEIVRSGAFWLGACGMLQAALYVVSAYGLLKLQRWAPMLTTLVLLVAFAWNTGLMALNPTPERLAICTVLAVVAFGALLVFLNRKVRPLYNVPPGGGEPVPA
jgi:hypothetical protein